MALSGGTWDLRRVDRGHKETQLARDLHCRDIHFLHIDIVVDRNANVTQARINHFKYPGADKALCRVQAAVARVKECTPPTYNTYSMYSTLAVDYCTQYPLQHTVIGSLMKLEYRYKKTPPIRYYM